MCRSIRNSRAAKQGRGFSRPNSTRFLSVSKTRCTQDEPSHLVFSDKKTDSPKGQLARRAQEKLVDRDFFLNLLSSAATKRDAKAYLSRLKSPRKTKVTSFQAEDGMADPHISGPSHGVNLGKFFGDGRAVEDRPVFMQSNDATTETERNETVHVALVKLTDPQNLDDADMDGIAHTLNQLARLSMIPCTVVDVRHPGQAVSKDIALNQADRLVQVLESLHGKGARRVDGLLSVSEEGKACSVASRKLMVSPIQKGRIPVIIPTAYTEHTQKAIAVSADDAMLALTRELAGLNIRPRVIDNPEDIAARFKRSQTEISVDRVILLDPAGGICTLGHRGKMHAFINLEQEYTTIANELQHESPREGDDRTEEGSSSTAALHEKNLGLLKAVLSILPPSASAIITTPKEAVNSSQISRKVEKVSGVRTRRQKNPLIHNLLTDKPAQSSSLPPGRLGLFRRNVTPPVTSTFVKKGMPLTILPDPTIAPWTADNHGQPRISLQDANIDLSRLVHLIEDSFDRRLDVEDYLKRVNKRLAGLIIAGEYEGGALLTWETPLGVEEDGSPESFGRLVPYLDKFAVLKRSQGAGGVADILFNAMVRGCLPDGVCWRSRGTNPVNKWYFERARGSWKIPQTNWTMFWTTPGVEANSQLFRDYESVCRGVRPSWADKKHIVD